MVKMKKSSAGLAIGLASALALAACGGKSEQAGGNDAMMSSGEGNDAMMTDGGAMNGGDAMSSGGNDAMMSDGGQMNSGDAMSSGNDAMATNAH